MRVRGFKARFKCSRCGRYHDRFRDRAKTSHASYCHRCHAHNARQNRKKYVQLTDEQKKRANCRTYTRTLVHRGKLIKQPCETCDEVKVEAHHEDYNDPHTVVWLCRTCHLSLHAARNAAQKSSNVCRGTIGKDDA